MIKIKDEGGKVAFTVTDEATEPMPVIDSLPVKKTEVEENNEIEEKKD